ncbi:MAG: aldo/keto reductase [Candidatus Aminicenantes bacterium]|nr:MAG: aldo/keto reductase [Candidatus Aminicenantes bacterium]
MRNSRIKRREFIGKATLGLCSTGLAIPLLKSNAFSSEKPQKIIYRTLGRTKLRIPVVSFGVMNSDSPDLIKRALDMGVNHLDTAHVYLRGNSERVIGEVLQRSGNRDKIYVATKMRFARDRDKNVFTLRGTEREPGASEENLFKQLETSLQRLRTDYIDILYLHSCYSPQMAVYEPLMNALVKAKKQGKARFIGVTTHSNEPDVIRASVDAGVYDVVLAAYNFAQNHRDKVKKAIKYAASKGVGVVAMKTQGGRSMQERGEIEINHEAALKWVLQDENVCTTIPGVTTFEQLDQNLRVMNNLALSGKERNEIQFASSLKGKIYCQNCRSCIPTCPSNAEIPNLMRAFMYAKAYGNYVQAGLTVAELPRKKGLNVCRGCSSCTASCPNGINIGSRVKTLIDEKLYLG